MDSQWASGIWISKEGEKLQIDDNLETKRLLSIAGHLKVYAISYWHYRFFFQRYKRLDDENKKLLTLYEDNFKDLIISTLEKHPSWSFVKHQLDKRNLYEYFYEGIE